MGGLCTQSIRGAFGPVERICKYGIQRLMVGFLTVSVKQLVGSVSLGGHQRDLATGLPASSCLWAMQYTTVFWWVRKKWVSLVVSCTSREARCSLTCSHFPKWEKSWVEKVSLGPELCHLGRRMTQVKLNSSSHPL